MTHGHKAGWSRLQRISIAHANAIGPQRCGTAYRRQIAVPDVIRENVDVLGRGSENDVKARLMWYLTFHPEMYSAS